ncbi:type 2 lanthipeptide synthetase LanM [Dickeya chrysanthemi]|uniref:type 2 lanthipeptide synthetase LanM n=1 Tax=Dickeya chrysanthemi TaxID=556 RepID=UPI0030162762
MRYKFSEPYRAYLYFHYLIDFNKKVKEIITAYGMPNLDFTDLTLYLSHSLDQIHLPDFVVRFDTWLRKQPCSHADRYISYFKDNEDTWSKNIRNNNKFISILALNICNSTISNIEKFLKRLLSEHDVLIRNFSCPPLSTIGKITIAAGDRHNDGQQPIILNLGDFKLIYKPRDSGIEDTLNTICGIIGLKNICPITLSMGTHLWQEFIENRELNSTTDAEKVYLRYGNILALVDLLNINDCHFDNFIVDYDNVFLIDPETSFQYFFDDSQEFERSVYQTGLLQSPDVVKNGLGHTSALTAVTNIFQSFTYPYAIHDATENIQVRYERGFPRKTQNFPHHQGIPVIAQNHISDVINGYTDTFIKLKKYHSKIIGYLKNQVHIKPRYLIRTTAYYLLVINKIIHPDISMNIEGKLSTLIDDYLRYPGAHPRFSELISYEKSCLIKYDIPIFHIAINSRSLFDGNFNEFTDFFPTTPLEQIDKYFSRDEQYHQRQHYLISRSMNVVYNPA